MGDDKRYNVVVKYACTKCGLQYDTPTEAVECYERNHDNLSDLELTNCTYTSGERYPRTVVVNLPSGRIATYDANRDRYINHDQEVNTVLNALDQYSKRYERFKTAEIIYAKRDTLLEVPVKIILNFTVDNFKLEYAIREIANV